VEQALNPGAEHPPGVKQTPQNQQNHQVSRANGALPGNKQASRTQRSCAMFVPFIYSIFVLILMLFFPCVIDSIPAGSLWMKQSIFACAAIMVWVSLSISAVSSKES
jgi:hypothetical protein